MLSVSGRSGVRWTMGSDQSKDKTGEQMSQVQAHSYDELSEQVSVIARLFVFSFFVFFAVLFQLCVLFVRMFVLWLCVYRASKNKDPGNHSHLTFRVEPKKEQLKMPSLWQKEVVVIVTTVPDLPDFWECRLSPDNRPYYINHAQQSTQWNPPWEIPYAPILAVPPVVCPSLFLLFYFSRFSCLFFFLVLMNDT